MKLRSILLTALLALTGVTFVAPSASAHIIQECDSVQFWGVDYAQQLLDGGSPTSGAVCMPWQLTLIYFFCAKEINCHDEESPIEW